MKINILITAFFLISSFGFSQTTPGEYEVKNLDSNTKFSDFGTTFFGEDKIIFSSSRGVGLLKVKWKKNNQPFLDLYEGVIDKDGNVNNVNKFSSKLNTRFHEASVSFTPDQKMVYFTRNNYFDNKLGKDKSEMTNIALYSAKVSPDGSWTDVESMPFNNVNYSVGSPSVSSDGSKLYFASDMPKSIGLTDIYVVDILDDGKYGIPKNLGSKINTSGSENFPFIDKDNILYFSSDGKEGSLGGLDVYAAKIYDASISEVLHLGSPVNSPADDFSYILKNEINEGYFSSNREGGKGDDDIYHFKASPPLKIECNQIANGIVKDKKTNEVIFKAIVILFDDKNTEIDRAITAKDGTFAFTIDCNAKYKVVASMVKYESDEATFKTDKNPDTKTELTLNLEPIIIPEVVVVKEKIIVNINSIYFDFDKFNIRPDAAIELDKVVAIMQKYPNLINEGGSHTDSRGPDSYNVILSSRRAKSTINYIILKGIDASRITAKGYGETQLLNHCVNGVACSEEDHQVNRRTEFVILNPDVLGYK